MINSLAAILAVASGGVVGALLRFAVNETVRRVVASSWVFAGTAAVNLAGCFAVGIVGTVAVRSDWLSPFWSRFLITGLLGSLTTFSAFAFETTELFRSGRSGPALMHIGINLCAGLLLVYAGMQLAEVWLANGSRADLLR